MTHEATFKLPAHPLNHPNPLVLMVMGSKTDWGKAMKHGWDKLAELGIPAAALIVSAHRTPDRMRDYAMASEGWGVKIIIAGAGGAAHLPGMYASFTPLPVIGVPVDIEPLNGVDSSHSIQQMPKGSPVATMAIGKPGAINSAVFALQLLALFMPEYKRKLSAYLAEKPNVELFPFDESSQ